MFWKHLAASSSSLDSCSVVQFSSAMQCTSAAAYLANARRAMVIIWPGTRLLLSSGHNASGMMHQSCGRRVGRVR